MPIHGPAAPPVARRALMVWEQLVQRGIRDQRVLDAMGRVPREKFVPASMAEAAYEDKALSIGHHQTISQPYMVALTLEALDLDESHRVLDVGTGSGYVAALLGELVREVITVEVVPELAREAGERLAALGYRNVKVAVTDGSKGYPPRAPFDRIAVAAAAPQVPPSLVDQLDGGGILVLPVGDRRHQVLRRVVRRRGEILESDLCPCVYVPLRGEEGWAEDEPMFLPERDGEEEQPR
jgi:protein-L-isoaspartate(D-aspartate) O-methyltransferase